MTRIPITMCHGLSSQGDFPLTADHLDQLVRIAHDLSFSSINYDELAAWRSEGADLPARPIMFDFDHPTKSMREGVQEVLGRYGYSGNLFINTERMDLESEGYGVTSMTWEEVGELMDLGWHIGAHTVTHPNFSALAAEDPDGEKVRWELATCDATLGQHLGITPRDFAFTGTSWSSMAEKLVMERYRFGRLWIVGTHYQADGAEIRYADLVGVGGEDEADGGPPLNARYITRDSHPYRLPSMEIQNKLMYSPESFRAYLQGALQADGS